MSYINKKGKTTSWRIMVIRQQVSDVFAYGEITTTLTKAKETQKHVDHLVTLAKDQTLASDRAILGFLKETKNADTHALLKKVKEFAAKQKDRQGGYTRVLKLGVRQGDGVEEAILSLVK